MHSHETHRTFLKFRRQAQHLAASLAGCFKNGGFIRTGRSLHYYKNTTESFSQWKRCVHSAPSWLCREFILTQQRTAARHILSAKGKPSCCHLVWQEVKGLTPQSSSPCLKAGSLWPGFDPFCWQMLLAASWLHCTQKQPETLSAILSVYVGVTCSTQRIIQTHAPYLVHLTLKFNSFC